MSNRHELVGGKVENDHFYLLLVGTRIKGEKVVKALYDHLVNGIKKSVAVKMHNANFSQFSTCLTILMDENQRVSTMVRFYEPTHHIGYAGHQDANQDCQASL